MFAVYHCPLCLWSTRVYDLWELEEIETFEAVERDLFEHVEMHVTELEEDIDMMEEDGNEA